MQSHRSDLPASTTLGWTPVPGIGSVRALGLSDALSVELQPSQVQGLIDELDELRRPLTEEFEEARDRWETAGSTSLDSGSGSVRTEEENMSRAGYALRALGAIRSQLPQHSGGEPVIVVGPSTTISAAISGAAISATLDLAEVLQKPHRGREAMNELHELAVAALAWVETYLDCYAVEWYSFDPHWDYVPRG